MFDSHSRLSVFLCLAFSLLLLVPGCGGNKEKEGNPSSTDTSGATNTDDSAADSSGDSNTTTNKGNSTESAASPGPATPGNSVAHPYISNDIRAAVIVHPDKIYQSSLLQNLMKAEMVRDLIDDDFIQELKREIQFDIRELQRFSLLVKSLPAGPGEMPSLGMVLEFTEAGDRSKAIKKLTRLDAPVEQDGMKWYVPEDTGRGPIVCVVNDKTIIVSTHLDLAKQMAAAPATMSPLNARLVELDYSNQHFVAVGSREMIPPALMAELQRELGSDVLPGIFSAITDVIAQLKAASAVISLSPGLNLKLTIETTSEENTTKLTTMVNDSLVLAKTTLGAIALVPPKEMPESMKPVIQETLRILSKIKVEQSASQLDIAMGIPESTLASLQKPFLEVIGSARGAAVKIQNMNTLKQIAIAIHNYHETYRQFPVGEGGDIKYKDGKPLLSWRVYLLPFLEGDTLYNKFKLDEPWDSPHNIQLLDQIPPFFVNPSQPGLGNKTTFVAPVGPGSILGETKKIRFFEVLDGTSQTIVVVEVGPDKAVPWTKPADLTYDLKDPVGSLGKIGDGFLAVFADGSVHRLNATIKPATLLNLFQRNDGNPIDFNELHK